MLKKVIKYTDFDGEEREETYYFNYTRAEMIEMNFKANGKLQDKVKGIVAAKNMKEIYELFKGIVLSAYGEKSEDGKRFVKSDEISKKFESTEAYSELMVELCTNENKAAEFISAILPKNMDLPVSK